MHQGHLRTEAHYACANSAIDILRPFLEHGGKITGAQSSDGSTPSMNMLSASSRIRTYVECGGTFFPDAVSERGNEAMLCMSHITSHSGVEDAFDFYLSHGGRLAEPFSEIALMEERKAILMGCIETYVKHGGLLTNQRDPQGRSIREFLIAEYNCDKTFYYLQLYDALVEQQGGLMAIPAAPGAKPSQLDAGQRGQPAGV